MIVFLTLCPENVNKGSAEAGWSFSHGHHLDPGLNTVHRVHHQPETRPTNTPTYHDRDHPYTDTHILVYCITHSVSVYCLCKLCA